MSLSKINAIGGFFGFELNKGKEYYPGLLKLNLGRSCLEYIIKANGYNRIHLAHFTCKVIIDTAHRIGVEVCYYSIDEQLEPIFDFETLGPRDIFLYTNYFGYKDKYIAKLTRIEKNVLIDNCQAFYSKPLPNITTFYSLRKFFGLPDGAYLATDKILDEILTQDVSCKRVSHLVKRIDIGPEEAFAEFQNNEIRLNDEPLKQMSNLTAKLLNSIAYEDTKDLRNSNYRYLHSVLGDTNELKLDFDNELSPLSYPYLSSNEGLRKKLIDNKIYIATYWPNVLDINNASSLEYVFAKNILHLPIDQRYGKEEMNRIIELILT
jgi:hypothetical protein